MPLNYGANLKVAGETNLRVARIELASPTWQAGILPLNDTREVVVGSAPHYRIGKAREVARYTGVEPVSLGRQPSVRSAGLIPHEWWAHEESNLGRLFKRQLHRRSAMGP